MKKIIIILTLIVSTLIYLEIKNNEVVIPDSAIRLRVIPNSNTSVDQNIKNKVKKYLEENTYTLLEGVSDLKEARTLINANIENLDNDIGNIFKENNYDFAGEFSGHVCFNDEFYGYDDALYAAGRLLRILSNTNMNVSDYFLDVPTYYSTPESYIEVGEENKDKIVNAVLEYAKSKKYEIIDIDGVRIEYGNGFALVRKSNTGPYITVRFEGKTKEEKDLHKNEIMNIINEVRND